MPCWIQRGFGAAPPSVRYRPLADERVDRAQLAAIAATLR
jgi:hypothetical protein